MCHSICEVIRRACRRLFSSFTIVGLGNWTWVVRLEGELLYLLSHSPIIFLNAAIKFETIRGERKREGALCILNCINYISLDHSQVVYLFLLMFSEQSNYHLFTSNITNHAATYETNPRKINLFSSLPLGVCDLLSLEWDEGHRSILSFLHILQMTQVTN